METLLPHHRETEQPTEPRLRPLDRKRVESGPRSLQDLVSATTDIDVVGGSADLNRNPHQRSQPSYFFDPKADDDVERNNVVHSEAGASRKRRVVGGYEYATDAYGLTFLSLVFLIPLYRLMPFPLFFFLKDL